MLTYGQACELYERYRQHGAVLYVTPAGCSVEGLPANAVERSSDYHRRRRRMLQAQQSALHPEPLLVEADAAGMSTDIPSRGGWAREVAMTRRRRGRVEQDRADAR